MPTLNREAAFDFETIHAIELEARRMRARVLAGYGRAMMRALRNLFSGHGAHHTA